MILLFGGTSETKPLALLLARAGYPVLVSTATAVELDVGAHPRIQRRSGRLAAAEMAALIRGQRITAVVDAAHPFAVELHQNVAHVCTEAGVPLLRLARPGLEPELMGDDIHWADHHDQAAALAGCLGTRWLLTIGSNHLLPYVQAALAKSYTLFARVLPEPDSLAACRQAGLLPNQVITGRGPFSLADNLTLLRALKIQVLITKESGRAGGLNEKIDAARTEGCPIVILRQPRVIGSAIHCDFNGIVGALERCGADRLKA